MQENPYQSPGSSLGDQQTYSGASGITPAILNSMAGTRPWVMFLSILGFIGAGLFFLAALLIFSMGSQLGGLGAGIGGALALFYVVLGAVTLILSIKLWKYASAIGELKFSPSTTSLETALEHQRSYWKGTGIVAIVVIGLYLLVIILGVSSAATSSTATGF